MQKPASPLAEPVRVALLGYGTVGSALHRALLEQRDHIRHATGRDVTVTRALVRDASRTRETPPGSDMDLVDDPDAIFEGRPDVICEAMGGLEPARSLVVRALGEGVPVVTANKQLVARHGTELFAAAEAGGAQLRFEASVCGAIPIVRMLRESLAPARVERLQGILNGTTNYILSAMTAAGASYDDALARAQELGYAEPDPTDDVQGHDAAAKLALLAGIAFHTRVDLQSVGTRGIVDVTAADVAHAAMLGCAIKAIGSAALVDGEVMVDVGPALVPLDHPLATVSGATNAVLVAGAPFGELTVQGAGAGGPETASALAGDLVGVMGSRPSFLTRDPCVDVLPVGDASEQVERSYVRLSVPDRAGALARVAQAFADRAVSIERLVQELPDERTGSAELVIVTHPAPRGATRSAVEAAADGAPCVAFPILDGAGVDP